MHCVTWQVLSFVECRTPASSIWRAEHGSWMNITGRGMDIRPGVAFVIGIRFWTIHRSVLTQILIRNSYRDYYIRFSSIHNDVFFSAWAFSAHFDISTTCHFSQSISYIYSTTIKLRSATCQSLFKFLLFWRLTFSFATVNELDQRVSEFSQFSTSWNRIPFYELVLQRWVDKCENVVLMICLKHACSVQFGLYNH